MSLVMIFIPKDEFTNQDQLFFEDILEFELINNFFFNSHESTEESITIIDPNI